MRRFVVCLIVVALLVGAHSIAWAQDGARYFPETGHTLDGRFARAFDKYGGLSILGYPITDSFTDPNSGLLIQYFQNARLELWPDPLSGNFRVSLRSLGEELGGWTQPVEGDLLSRSTSPGCKYYQESGHRVCFAFLDFFLSNGGPEVFGYPISEFEIQDGWLVQYFQRFKLVWDPGAASSLRVQIAPLGRAHFEVMGYDERLLRPQQPNNIYEYRVVELRPRTSVAKPIASHADTQEVYVVIEDQNLNPVEGAAVLLVVHLADQELSILMPPTNASGTSMVEFSFQDQPPGLLVSMEFWIAYGDLVSSTRDSFRVWW